ncbi:riboflavin biosynthesis protein RibF [Pseudohongiella acticola]|jgi:riboflavin kinase / FMN adenylyltransferase|uniref:Riboflavin biosynthesis protein n=1 Tax=Pseudohongiella acticola TaxID=1524254 RepID=A0A1E8CIR3_9GAMM|nr:bifunctional riboflavin kinase/FAD synthetase [Pseudohongiella acticola]OFE12294.1 riboflavin biosynthesis protein RibF [Pseudohongiella acticola]
MRVIHNTEGFLQQHSGCVATIGKFDGVHLGHQRIVAQLLEKAADYAVPSVVIVIEPHPEEFFASDPRSCPPRLSEAGEKVELLRAMGVDYVYLLEFNQELSQLSPESYVEDVLVAGLNVRCLIVGNDFRFGYQRGGDFELLCRYGKRAGFDVVETASCVSDGVRVSSTYVRECLAKADFDRVAEVLGRPYTISGTVVRGQQLGRDLGFPTCNLALNRRNIPLHGVYACTVEIFLADDECIAAEGAANIGYRPTVKDNGKALLEVHLLNFDQEIYGARVSVTFRHRVRPEQKFESLDALKARIALDVEEVRQYFSHYRQ